MSQVLTKYRITLRSDHKSLYTGYAITYTELEAFQRVCAEAVAQGIELPEEVWCRSQVLTQYIAGVDPV